jgi:hypothetical protein
MVILHKKKRRYSGEFCCWWTCSPKQYACRCLLISIFRYISSIDYVWPLLLASMTRKLVHAHQILFPIVAVLLDHRWFFKTGSQYWHFFTYFGLCMSYFDIVHKHNILYIACTFLCSERSTGQDSVWFCYSWIVNIHWVWIILTTSACTWNC